MCPYYAYRCGSGFLFLGWFFLQARGTLLLMQLADLPILSVFPRNASQRTTVAA